MKGLDVDSDPSVWLAIPREWTANTGTDHRDWARDAAEAVFHGARDRREVDVLAGLLAFLAEDPKIAPEQTQSAYLHLPGPGTDVLPVYVQFFDSEGARDEALREMAEADGDAVEPPIVEPVTTARLGQGLRVLRYTLVDEDELLLSLAYGFRHDGFDIRIRTFALDHGRVLRVMDDIEDLVRATSVVEQDED